MNLMHRTQNQVLLSLSSAEFGLIDQALARLASSEAEQCLASLRAQVETRPASNNYELVEAWVNGASVQVRAITVHADPVDMGTEEARDYAQRILDAANTVDAIG